MTRYWEKFILKNINSVKVKLGYLVFKFKIVKITPPLMIFGGLFALKIPVFTVLIKVIVLCVCEAVPKSLDNPHLSLIFSFTNNTTTYLPQMTPIGCPPKSADRQAVYQFNGITTKSFPFLTARQADLLRELAHCRSHPVNFEKRLTF